MEIGSLSSWVFVAVFVAFVWGILSRRGRENAPAPMPVESSPPAPTSEFDHHASAVELAVQEATHPEHLHADPRFVEAIRFLRDGSMSDDELLERARLATLQIDAAALIAYVQRHPEDHDETLFATLPQLWTFGRYAVLRQLDAMHPPPQPLVLRVLPRLDQSWFAEAHQRALQAWITGRHHGGENPLATAEEDAGAWIEELTEEQQGLAEGLLGTLPADLASPWLRAIRLFESPPVEDGEPASTEAANARTGSMPALDDVGRWWTKDGLRNLQRATGTIAPLDEQTRARDACLQRLRSASPRSIVVVGPSRAGKSTVIRRVVASLLDDAWRAWDASPDQLNAGAGVVGHLEKRVGDVLRAFAPGRHNVWTMPELVAMFSAGSVQGDESRSVGRLLRGALLDHRLVMITECDRASWLRLQAMHPWLTDAFHVVDLDVPSDDDTLALARAVYTDASGAHWVDDELLQTAWELTRTLGDETQRPGNLIDLLRRPVEAARQAASDGTVRAIDRDALFESVSTRTGLPLELLDERIPLDVEAATTFFRTRVRGQDEAIEGLIDRLAMIKTAVTDPSRPLGVFLLAGPTGTGKTELAKTLAEWLFGSQQRLIRIDMSELKHPQSLDRLLGSERPAASGGHALVDRVREQPFSVILLDEFEKSHPEVWDLFLQLFDDGRLSDHSGRSVDFRQCVILVTTNLGSAASSRTSVGFRTQPQPFRADAIHDALRAALRPELLNRFDRVIVFHPLSRDLMREILVKQIEATIARRGLRDRPWAVEWSDDAIEFLLDRGFTHDLGARPLQRAIESHVLGPLARTIATQQTPDGDQFLFVRREGDGLRMEFVDPDADDDAPTARIEGRGVGAIALDGTGHADELAELAAALDDLEARLHGDDTDRERTALLERMGEASFWDDDARFAVLDRFESLDRLRRAVESGRSFHTRLTSGRRHATSPEAIRRLARKVHTLGVAWHDLKDERPNDVVLAVRPHALAIGTGDGVRDFADRMIAMYEGWVEATGAKLVGIDALATGDDAPFWAVHVAGLGVAGSLGPESGLHHLEEPSADGERPSRLSIRVDVVDVPADREPAIALDAAIETLRRQPLSPEAVPVVRRYRERPSPLVRDAVRGWRTGRIDRVFAGQFDLIESADEPGRVSTSEA